MCVPVKADTLTDLANQMTEKVGLVHGLPYVADRQGFAATLEQVSRLFESHLNHTYCGHGRKCYDVCICSCLSKSPYHLSLCYCCLQLYLGSVQNPIVFVVGLCFWPNIQNYTVNKCCIYWLTWRTCKMSKGC